MLDRVDGNGEHNGVGAQHGAARADAPPDAGVQTCHSSRERDGGAVRGAKRADAPPTVRAQDQLSNKCDDPAQAQVFNIGTSGAFVEQHEGQHAKAAGATSPVQTLVELSPGFVSWMIRHRISLACSASNLGHLLLIGSRSDGTAAFSRAQFQGARGLAAFSHRIYLADRTSVWRLENTLRSREVVQNQYDRLFVPRNAQLTGDIGAHELAVEPSGRIIVVATKYSCLATASATHAFKPLWKPAFVSKLAPEDRCHLNGLGMEDGHVRYATACSTADIVDGWRDHRASGGVLIDVASDRVLADGLSMPHSPRLHCGSIWFLNSGSGHLCQIDPQTGRRDNVAFCPGFLRGLAFVEHFAIVTLSLPRHGRFQGLELDDQLTTRRATPWCGLVIIDTRNGDVVEWLRLGAEFSELFDVALVPGTRCAVAIAPDSPLLQDAITIEQDFAALADADRGADIHPQNA